MITTNTKGHFLTFESEANLSNFSYLSPENRRAEKSIRTKKRLKRMKDEECAICFHPMSPMGSKQTFAKTPCNHKFHE